MITPNTNKAIKQLLRDHTIGIFKDLENQIDRLSITLTMQELTHPIAEYAKGLMDAALIILDDEDVNIASLGKEGEDLKKRSEVMRATLLKLFNENIAPILK